MTAISQPIPAPARNHSIPTEPGYITTLSLGGSDYYVHAYIEAADGTRTYLPQNCDPQVLEKVRSLTWGMFNAHEELRKSRNETPLSVRHVDATGLVKTDNTVTSHDFAIQPVSSLVASTMADALTRDGCPQEATTIKTQDVWNRMETLIRTTIGQPSSNPISPSTSTNTST